MLWSLRGLMSMVLLFFHVLWVLIWSSVIGFLLKNKNKNKTHLFFELKYLLKCKQGRLHARYQRVRCLMLSWAGSIYTTYSKSHALFPTLCRKGIQIFSTLSAPRWAEFRRPAFSVPIFPHDLCSSFISVVVVATWGKKALASVYIPDYSP